MNQVLLEHFLASGKGERRGGTGIKIESITLSTAAVFGQQQQQHPWDATVIITQLESAYGPYGKHGG